MNLKKQNKSSLSLILMIILSMITQMLTIVKSSLVAGRFGLSTEMDAFNFASSIVSFLFGLIAGGVPTVILPQYVKKKDNQSTNAFLTIIYLFLFVIIVLIIILRYQITGLLTNRNTLFVNITCNLLIILLLSQYMLSITNITAAFYQSQNYFNIPKVITLISQLFVVFLLINTKELDIYSYTYIITLGVIINFTTDVFMAKKIGWSFIPVFKFKNQEVYSLFTMFFPIVLSTSVYNISLFCDSAIAARFSTGKLTILSYSNQISGIINTVLIGNLVIYVYPKIIHQVEEINNQKDFWNIVILFHSIVCLIIVAFFAIGKEGVSLLFEHGQFNSNAVNGVFFGTFIYVLGMQTNVVRDLIYRYFYAYGNTSIPAKNSIIVSILNIVFSLVLVCFIGFYGIIFGTIIASFISLMMIIYRFKQTFVICDNFKEVIISILKNIIVCIFTCVIFTLIRSKYIVHNLLISILAYGVFIVIIYLLLVLLFNKQVYYILKKFNND